MMPTIDADEAWCPPTLISSGGRSRLAWSTIRTASHSTRRWISSSASRCQGDPDEIDRAILVELERNARATYGELGEVVGLSAPAVKRRMDRLVAGGIIRGYTVVVDHARLGRPIEAFTELTFSGNARVDEIASIGDGIPEVLAVFTMAGDPDALAWLRVADVRDLKRVIDRLRQAGNLTGTKTMIVLGGPNHETR
jgi:Lrp/AsnC family transcriptional regulator, leucine-responsive regulatory protein